MLDFERYAKEKLMKGKVAENWIKPFKQFFLKSRIHYRNCRVLDYGFGDGRYFSFFLQYFDSKNIYGIEVSKLRTDRARAKGWQNAICLNLDEEFPYEDNFFDFINMVEIIEHIPSKDIDFYLSELSRSMAPDGVLILTTPNYPIKRIYDILDAFIFHRWKRLRDDSTHVTFYNHKRLKKLLDRYFEAVHFFAYKEGTFYRKLEKDFFCHKILAVCLRPQKTLFDKLNGSD